MFYCDQDYAENPQARCVERDSVVQAQLRLTCSLRPDVLDHSAASLTAPTTPSPNPIARPCNKHLTYSPGNT